ncbi:hypothetical protein H0X09_01305 [Candidatus Saccharibacteria bacterium]|nr:hypothetical protein [Candidatus Saccharibacteria bacterium]
MSIGPETYPFSSEPELAPMESLVQQIYEKFNIRVMMVTDFTVAETDDSRYTAIVLSEDELIRLQKPNPRTKALYRDTSGPNTSFSILTEEVGLPMDWAQRHPTRASASTQEDAVELAYAAWVRTETTPPPMHSPLQ